jgi:hypothetical protein
MLCANIINGEINLVEEDEIVKLANWDEVMDRLDCGEIELEEFTRILEGILVWDNEECDFELVEI